jgi:tRNA pseudouridine55 synthase
MLIKEIDQNLLNVVQVDLYDRVAAVLLIDKPKGVTSHDVVDDVRRILRTRKVGHAGALDPFATGLVVILVGKYTKYSQAFINLNKTYRAEIVLGVGTQTQDPEGELITSQDLGDELKLSAEKIEQKIRDKFMPAYDQVVPVFSSVKIEGNKLRVLARKAERIEYLEGNEVCFHYKKGESPISGHEEIVVDRPTRKVEIGELIVHSVEKCAEVLVSGEQKQTVSGNFLKVDVEISCSKGTYIRQFAEDVGAQFGLPGFLVSLNRTRVGDYHIEQSFTIDEIYERAKEIGIQDKSLQALNLKLLR